MNKICHSIVLDFFYSVRGAHRKIVTGDKLNENRVYFHRRGFVILPISGLQVARVDTAALLQKITDGERAFVVDNTSGFIDQLVAELGNECLNRDFIHWTIGWYT